MDAPLIFGALLLGLGTSLHCVGMCGPIAFSLGISGKNSLKFAGKNLLYQTGRVTTYTIMGASIGLIGEGFNFAGAQRYLSIFAGLVMILMVLIPKNLSNKNWGKGWVSGLLVQLKVKLGVLIKKKNYTALYMTGLLNGLLPCGPVYAALTAALAIGSLLGSSVFMMLFGIGTIPLMFATVVSGSFMSVALRNKIMRILPIITIILGVLFVLRGLGLAIPFLSPPDAALEVNAKSCCS